VLLFVFSLLLAPQRWLRAGYVDNIPFSQAYRNSGLDSQQQDPSRSE
jgi:hypothetical protein